MDRVRILWAKRLLQRARHKWRRAQKILLQCTTGKSRIGELAPMALFDIHVASTSQPRAFVMTACWALIRPSGEGRSCILDSLPGNNRTLLNMHTGPCMCGALCDLLAPPLPIPPAQALPCPSTEARLTVVFLVFSDHGFWGRKCSVTWLWCDCRGKRGLDHACGSSCCSYQHSACACNPTAVRFDVIFSHG